MGVTWRLRVVPAREHRVALLASSTLSARRLRWPQKTPASARRGSQQAASTRSADATVMDHERETKALDWHGPNFPCPVRRHRLGMDLELGPKSLNSCRPTSAQDLAPEVLPGRRHPRFTSSFPSPSPVTRLRAPWKPIDVARIATTSSRECLILISECMRLSPSTSTNRVSTCVCDMAFQLADSLPLEEMRLHDQTAAQAKAYRTCWSSRGYAQLRGLRSSQPDLPPIVGLGVPATSSRKPYLQPCDRDRRLQPTGVCHGRPRPNGDPSF